MAGTVQATAMTPAGWARSGGLKVVLPRHDPPERPVAEQVLDLLPRAVLGADMRGRLVLANRAGRALLAAGAGLRQDGTGRLAAEEPDADRMLRRLLALAAAGTGRPGTVLGVVQVLRREGMPLHVSVLAADTPPRADGVTALLLAADPDARPGGHAALALLRDAYGLTQAEAEVALGVAAGEGLPAVAAMRGIAPSTARSHLQRVFEKTGTRRQAQLARLLAQLGE